MAPKNKKQGVIKNKKPTLASTMAQEIVAQEAPQTSIRDYIPQDPENPDSALRTSSVLNVLRQMTGEDITPGTSAQFSLVEPASMAQMARPMVMAGVPLEPAWTGEMKDGSPEMALLPRQDFLKSQLVPGLQRELDLTKATPTELDLSSLSGLVKSLNIQSANNPLRQFSEIAPSKNTAMDKRNRMMELQALMQKERDKENENRLKLLSMLSGMQAVKSSGSIKESYAPVPRSGGQPKPKELSEGEVKVVNQIDSRINALKTLLESVKPDWVGVGDQLKSLPIVSSFQSPEYNAFSSDVGTLEDRYRQEITGAAAATSELRRIAGRLPKLSDNYKSFVLKAQKALKDTEALKENTLKNYGLTGRIVREGLYESPGSRGEINKTAYQPSAPAPISPAPQGRKKSLKDF